MPALLGAALAGVLLVASSAGPGLLAAAVVLMVAVLAFGGLAQVPVAAARPSALLALVAGATGALGTWGADAGDWAVDSELVVSAVATGLAFVAAFVLQLARRHGRAHLVTSLSLAASGVAAAGLGAWWVGARIQPEGAAVVALGLAGVGLLLLVAGLPLPGPPAVWRAVASVAGAGAGAVLSLAGWPADVELGKAVGVAAASALAGLAALAAVERGVAEAALPEAAVGPAEPPLTEVPPATLATTLDPRSGARLAAWSLAATLPLCLAAPATYLVGRLLLG